MNNKQSYKMAYNNNAESQISSFQFAVSQDKFSNLFHTLHTEVERSFIEIPSHPALYPIIKFE